MSAENKTTLSALPFSASTSQNVAGGGVSAESFQLRNSSELKTLLTIDNRAPFVVLRALRGERLTCARALRSGLATDAFSPQRVALRREGGTWVAHVEPLWQGYVLAEPAPGVTAEDLGAVGQLSQLESALVRRLCGSSHVIPVSEGRIQSGQLTVLFGPLMGLEPLVRKIDRHKRLAWLEPEPGRRIPVGLEVTSKS
ncbi:hypothetical protein [Thermophilibacter provencensis]|uniref:Uncharacterized protein n=1 Tax=Thermophilibacter provencensis TaxID=1852386 RepID=A0ABT7V2F6_9ACTN|nr:hypothetical protein [Thermophilibacter provencensis]MDM8270171.1 hypothetical protein [Thermophilibacter provencensis]